jgi:preprotein translocase subunit SecE
MPITFLQQTYAELKQVIWPTRNEIFRLTGVVIAISVFIGLYIGGLDYVFAKLMGLIIK